MEQLQEQIDTVCYFAAYFDETETPFIPEESLQTFASAREQFGSRNWENYLTFVNDRLREDGTSSLKDTELLYHLMEKEEAREEHIDEILTLTEQNGFDGIEIDYEAIKEDHKLWELFLSFAEELIEAAGERELKVRIVLEPGVPVQELDFPEGAEYVIMCYNLCGYGTEPGPKADRDFLIEMAEKLKQLPSPGNMALSLGGFDFASDGTVTQLTEQECVALLQRMGSTASRDSASGDLVFTYESQEGMTHEVWYADDETLQFWMQTGREKGCDRFSIWRLGSNVTLR